MKYVALLLTGIFVSALHATADWPEWRGGPERTAVWNDPNLPKTLPAAGPKVLWRQEIGSGYSGPSVANGRVYVMDRLLPPEAPEQVERILCFDAATGEHIWTHAYPHALKLRGGYENGPRSTPTVRDGRVHALGAMGDFHCLDAATGAVVWKKNLREEYDIQIPMWGMASSPLIEGDAVIFQAAGRPGATVLALHRNTGEELWRSLSEKAAYVAPLAITSGGQRQLIIWTGESIHSLNPAAGQPFWSVPRASKWDEAVATPLFHPELNLLLLCHDWEGTITFQLASDKPGFEVLWDSRSLSALHSTPVLDGEYLYGLNHSSSDAPAQGELRCVNIRTGEVRWTNRSLTRPARWAQAHLTRNDGNGVYYILTDWGELVLAELSPEGYKELSRAQLTPKTWAHPAFAYGRVFARSEQSLISADLSAE